MSKVNRNNGRSFEQIVAIIQEFYKDSPHTQIYTNYKIEDTTPSRKLREFDIFIVSQVNGFPLKIAIECKDHKYRVPLKEVEAFHTKCSFIAGINKKIMVSSRGYQSGVRETADRCDIELYTLSTLQKSSTIPWTTSPDISHILLHQDVKGYTMWVKNETLGMVPLEKRLIDATALIQTADQVAKRPTAFILDQLEGANQGPLASVLIQEAARQRINFQTTSVSTTHSFIMNLTEAQPIKLTFAGHTHPLVQIDLTLALTTYPSAPTSIDIKTYESDEFNQGGQLTSAQFTDEGKTIHFYQDKHTPDEQAIVAEQDQLTRLPLQFIIHEQTGELKSSR